jgi:hypothetical protein
MGMIDDVGLGHEGANEQHTTACGSGGLAMSWCCQVGSEAECVYGGVDGMPFGPAC